MCRPATYKTFSVSCCMSVGHVVGKTRIFFFFDGFDVISPSSPAASPSRGQPGAARGRGGVGGNFFVFTFFLPGKPGKMTGRDTASVLFTFWFWLWVQRPYEKRRNHQRVGDHYYLNVYMTWEQIQPVLMIQGQSIAL